VADTSHLIPGQRPQATAAAGEEHAHPGPKVYIQVALWLAVATAIEVGLYYLDMPHGLFIGLLMFLMIIKFSVVAMYFMHLKFEAKTLGWIAVTPLAIATLLVFVLLPDGFAVLKTTDAAKKPAATAPAKH
jgi:cytochrome c oxidase subunit 4